MDTKKVAQATSVGRRLAALLPSDDDWELLAFALAHSFERRAGHEFDTNDGKSRQGTFVLSGWAGMTRVLADGRRQIVDLHLPGDLTASSRRADSVSFVCLTDAGFVDVDSIVREVDAEPQRFSGWTSLFASLESEGRNRLIDQIVRTGRMQAHERLAHLTLDLHRRLERVGLSTANGFPMPLTQEVLADILGMSTVHINRTLQQLRRERLIRTSSSHWEILDAARLREVAAGTARHGHWDSAE